MNAQGCVSLSIGMLLAAVNAWSTGWSTTAPILGAGLRPDTSLVFSAGASLRPFRQWGGDDARSLRSSGLPLDLESVSRTPALDSIGRTAMGSPEPAVDPDLYGTDGNVASMARSGNTLYIAGSFRSVGENSGGFVAIDTATGVTRQLLPKVAGSVAVIVPDGSGGWYIGGDFTGVGGKARSCLARIFADGTVSDWNPDVTGSPGYITPPLVSAIAVWGDHMFVGGAFRDIGGRSHENLGCVDIHTGVVLDWNLDTNIDEPVRSLAVHGDTVFVGGRFSSLGGVPRSSLAAVSAATGVVLSWRVDLYGGANALLASGDTLYVGGDFTEMAGYKSSKLAAASISGAAPLPMDFRINGIYRQYLPGIQVDALARVNDTLYVVGNFTAIGGQVRSGIAALDARTGLALPWSPDTTGPRPDGYPPPLCVTVAVSGGTLYVGGFFGSVEGAYHPLVAAWDRQTGHVLGWTPTPDDVVTALAVRGDMVFAGGYFHMMGAWQHRAGLAAIDLTTGRLRPWNPNPNGVVCTAIAASGDRVFVSGDFSLIGGDPQPRAYIAALDTINGQVMSWNPGANDVATTFLLSGETLYAGGYFTEVGGQPRSFAAAFDIASGEVLDWDPNADYPVLAMARSGNSLYLGGLFSQVAGRQRLGLAAVNAWTAALSSWNPGTDNRTVKALLVAGNTIYVGGAFGVIGGQARNAIAALDATSGAASPWYPPPTAWGVPVEVKALAIRGSVLYVGGAFASLNGEPRICLAAVDTSTGVITGWDPGLDGYVWSLMTSDNVLYVGGGFSRAGGIPASGLTAFALPRPPQSLPIAFALAQCAPNPVGSSTSVNFSLPQAATVSLDVYDVQGRRVLTALDRSPKPPGQYEVTLQLEKLPPGVYLYRLQAGETAATRRLVVAR
jgi:hypothetical protein